MMSVKKATLSFTWALCLLTLALIPEQASAFHNSLYGGAPCDYCNTRGHSNRIPCYAGCGCANNLPVQRIHRAKRHHKHRHRHHRR